MMEAAIFTIAQSPKPVGAYVLGEGIYQFHFTLTRKPLFLHRWMMRMAFGLVWRDRS